MGIFAGSLRFTSYRGSNLLRMEAIAKTDEQSVAYKYEGGLKGFSTALTPRVTWRDRGGDPQQYEFGGLKNDSRVTVKAKNRVLVAGGGKNGSIATFTPPHVFFFTREVDTNLGYVWYRKDGDAQFGMGVRQAEGEEVQQYIENFALHNAPPGTMQRMAVYYLITPGHRRSDAAGGDGLHARRRLQAGARLQDDGEPLPSAVHRAAACVGIARQHVRRSDGDALDRHQHRRAERLPRRSASERSGAGPVRRSARLLRGVAEGVRQGLPRDQLGRADGVLRRPLQRHVPEERVLVEGAQRPGSRLRENVPGFGKVYHTGSTTDVQQMLDAENGYWFHSHPRTKGTTGYPDAIFDKAWVKNDRYLGIAFKPAMGDDLSDPRMCEWRCFDAIDTMNNLYANTGLRPKYLIADVDTYRKGPEDDIYPGHPINYVKLDRLPGPTDDWTPILRSIRNGDFWVSTGEILIKNYAVEGTGAKRTIVGGSRVHLSARVRRSRLGRRQEGRDAGHSSDRHWRTARRSSRFRSTRPARSGCGLRCGTRRATARSRSHRG